jgi:hypothetical protein
MSFSLEAITHSLDVCTPDTRTHTVTLTLTFTYRCVDVAGQSRWNLWVEAGGGGIDLHRALLGDEQHEICKERG